MKFITCVVLSLSFLTANANAQEFSWGGERIALIVDLPNTDYYAINGALVDIGIIFKQIGIEGFSILNYNKRWCLFSGETYWEMDKAELDEIAQEAGISLPSTMNLPFAEEWGGRLTLLGIIIGVILIALIWNKIRPKVKILKPLNDSLNKNNAANMIFRGYYKIKKINNAEVKWSAAIAKAASVLLPPGYCSVIFDYYEENVAKGKGFTAAGNLEAGKTYLLKSVLKKDNTLTTNITECRGDDLKKYLAFLSNHLEKIE